MAIGLFQFDGGSGLDPRYDITAPVFDKAEFLNGVAEQFESRNRSSSAKWSISCSMIR